MMIVTIITSSSGKDRTPSAKNSKYHQGTEVLFWMDQKFEPSKHLNWVSNVDTNLLSLMWYFEKHGSSSLSKSMKTSFKSATTSFESSHSSWVQIMMYNSLTNFRCIPDRCWQWDHIAPWSPRPCRESFLSEEERIEGKQQKTVAITFSIVWIGTEKARTLTEVTRGRATARWGWARAARF